MTKQSKMVNPEPGRRVHPERGRRIGVFVCECGRNIAGSVDCEAVRAYAAELPGVVYTTVNKYTCSEPGQQEIKKGIVEHDLDRVVVASCTPRNYEPIFRQCVAEAGMNPYLMTMANIREGVSWVHIGDVPAATRKAREVVEVAVAKARWLHPLRQAEVKVTPGALVIGGGIAGIQSALDLADAGHQVYLVEKEPSIGGKMAQLDKTFPTMDCSIWILGPKMMDVGRHPNVKLLAYSEVEEISGYVGNFSVKVRKKARYVDENACTACGDCVAVCPVTAPDEFQGGLSTRRAIHIPFPQAVPSAYLIHAHECLGNNPIACGKCREVCDKDCIDFDMQDEILTFDVGAVVVATGLEVFDPTGLTEYGYTRYENVISSIEFERLISSGGPTEGHFVRPTDMQRPRNIGFIQCVGSRTVPTPGSNGDRERGHPYCSNICCMNTVKDSLLLLDHYPDSEITVYYMDIRAFGKGFEDMYRRSKEAGVRYVRGLPGQILEDPTTRNLRMMVENTMTGELATYEHDMVVLSLGLVPPEDQELIKKLLTLSTTEDGFFMESHPKLKPVDAPTEGVFFAGCAEGPKDVKDSVTQASAAAARAQTILNKRTIKLEPVVAWVDPELCNACGRCVRVCPFHAIVGGDAKKKIKAEVIEAMCHGCGTCAPECNFEAITIRYFTDQQIVSQIDAALAHDPHEKILTFACNWCSYAGSDLAGISRLQYPPNARVIRTMCSGRVDPDFVWRSFAQGAAMVLVSGCHYADCHYIDANRQTVKRVDRLWNKLERKGIRPERLQLEWISAAEGQKWAQVMRDLEEMRQAVTREEVEETMAILNGGSRA